MKKLLFLFLLSMYQTGFPQSFDNEVTLVKTWEQKFGEKEIILNTYLFQSLCYTATNKFIVATDMNNGMTVWKYNFDNMYIYSVPEFYDNYCAFTSYTQGKPGKSQLIVLSLDNGQEILVKESQQYLFKVPVIIANNVAYCITGQLTKWKKLYDKNTFKESYLNAFQLDNNKELYRIPLKDKTATILKSIDNYIAATQDVKTDQKGNISNLLGLYSIETGKLFKKTKVKFITTRSYINDIIKLDENDKNKYLVCSNLFNYYTKNGIKLHIL